MAQEIRIKLSERMDELLTAMCNGMGIKKTEYVKSLMLEDIKKRRNGEHS